MSIQTERQPHQGDTSVLDSYILSAPHPQNALDIFKGQWSSVLPGSFSTLRAGGLGLFEDSRVNWFADAIGGVKDKSVLELGPLEGGHTYMLERMGARKIVAVEANTRAFLKCLVVKELLGICRANFLCGSFVEYLRTGNEVFDICLASGVLYHMQNPAELIALISERCKGYLCLWTHYYDASTIARNPVLAPRFHDAAAQDYRGFQHTLHTFEYQDALQHAGFCGGGATTSRWMTRDDLFRGLRHFGFEIEGVAFDSADHPNGPALALVARRVSP